MTAPESLTEIERLPSFAALFARVAAEQPNREAIVMPRLRWTYGEFYARALTRAAAFRRLGLKPGAPVGLMIGNRPEFLELFVGAAMAGLLAVLIPTRYKARELTHVFADSDSEVVLALADPATLDLTPLLHEAFPGLADANGETLALAQAPRLKRLYGIGGAGGPVRPYAEFTTLADAASEAEIAAGIPTLRADAPFYMLYTSGTTAFPKGCPVNSRALVGVAERMQKRFRIAPGARIWDALPFYHVSFITMFAAAVQARGTMVTAETTDPETALDMMERERVDTGFPVFDYVWQRIIGHAAFRPERLATLRTILVVDPMDGEASERLLPNLRIIASFSMSESSGFLTLADVNEDAEARMKTIGYPVPGVEARLWDVASDAPAPPGGTGEIQVRGFSIFTGYHKSPEKNREVMLADGWFRTGDLGMWDAAGRLVFRGRDKDMLKVGGENVAAVEIEALLATHPAVAVAQVVGVPDERLTEVPAAFIELYPGAALTPDAMVAWCRGKIANFKLPRHVRVVSASEWPMSATKMQKAKLKEMDPGPRLIA
jgi:acyl-CoA synthetase (AMP-forming)/AMP-acid ligase II